jgi:hypothetical protein
MAIAKCAALFPTHGKVYFLTPTDFSRFFDQVRNNSLVGWRSGLMQELKA